MTTYFSPSSKPYLQDMGGSGGGSRLKKKRDTQNFKLFFWIFQALVSQIFIERDKKLKI